MSKLITKIRKNFRNKGIGGVTVGFFRLLLRFGYESKPIVMLSKPLRADYRTVPFPPSLRNRTYEFFHATSADVDRIGFIDGNWKRWIKAYLSEGAKIQLSGFDGEIFAYSLCHFRMVLDLPRGLRIPLEEHQIYQFDGNVAPEMRGKGYAQYHGNSFELEMMKSGRTEAVCLVEELNKTSMRFHERNGFRVVKHGTYFRLGTFKWWKWVLTPAVNKAMAVSMNP